MSTDIDSAAYRPKFRIEQHSRSVQYTPEGTVIEKIYWISDYRYHREALRILTGGVRISDRWQRAYPKTDSYFGEMCYCFDASASMVDSEALCDGNSMQPGELTHATTHAGQTPLGTTYSPIQWGQGECPNGGAFIKAQFRSVRAPYDVGNANFDFVDAQYVYSGQTVSASSRKLGWRYEDETPAFWGYNIGEGASVSEPIVGFECKRIYVPDAQFRYLNQIIFPYALGCINGEELKLPILNTDGSIYRFEKQTLRLDSVKAVPHVDTYNNVFWTLIYNFAVAWFRGGKKSGFETDLIGFNSLYNPEISLGAGVEPTGGYMRVSEGTLWYDATPARQYPDQPKSIYTITNAFPSLFRMAASGIIPLD